MRGLDDAPGIYSARWAGPDRDFKLAMSKVVNGLCDKFGSFGQADRSAAFVSILCLAWPDGHAEFYKGRVDGTLAETPRGSGGFGYDPIFIPAGERRTFAEMENCQKNQMSHRALALRQLIEESIATSSR